MKVLGIDYGNRKVGLAISEGLLASPLKVIEVNSLKDAVEKIKQVVITEEIDEAIIGLPESGEARKMVESFVKAFRPIVNISTVDETLTSFHAVKNVKIIGRRGGGKIKEDAESAAIILENYLEDRHLDRD